MSVRSKFFGTIVAVFLARVLCPAQLSMSQVTPDQLRQVAPPAPTASAEQLETQADQFRATKFYADACDYYEAALAKQDTAVLHNKLGITKLNMMRYAEAKKEFERSLKLDKNYAEAYNNLGVIYYAVEHNNRKAVRNYEKAIKINPNSASFHSNLGTALFARKDFDKAAKEYQQAMQIDPGIFERRSRTGIAAQLPPTDRGNFAYTVAKLYLQTGDLTHCLLYLKKAQEEGIKVEERLKTDPAFDKYKADPRFIAVIRHQPLELPQQQ
jgi:tetratricopeptide (TPR) repeat protein